RKAKVMWRLWGSTHLIPPAAGARRACHRATPVRTGSSTGTATKVRTARAPETWGLGAAVTGPRWPTETPPPLGSTGRLGAAYDFRRTRGVSFAPAPARSEEHTSELQSRENLVC